MITATRAVEAVVQGEDEAEIKPLYLEALTLVERLHRRLLDVIKDEFDRMGRSDVNSVQALLLFNIGDAELTAGELRSRGYYLGSNVSYNVRKMVENGYLVQERSSHDRRSVRVRLSDKGLEVHETVNKIINSQAGRLGETGITDSHLDGTGQVLTRLERFLLHTFGYASPR